MGTNTDYTFFSHLHVHSFCTCWLGWRVWGTHLGTWVSAWRHLVEGVLGQPTHAPVLLNVQWLSKPQLLLEVIFLLTFCFQWSDDGVLKADSTRCSFSEVFTPHWGWDGAEDPGWSKLNNQNYNTSFTVAVVKFFKLCLKSFIKINWDFYISCSEINRTSKNLASLLSAYLRPQTSKQTFDLSVK